MMIPLCSTVEKSEIKMCSTCFDCSIYIHTHVQGQNGLQQWLHAMHPMRG